MKSMSIFFFAVFSFSISAAIDTNNCPEEIKISYSNLKNVDLTEEISDNEVLYTAYQNIQYIPEGEINFHMITGNRIPGVCTYLTGTNGWDSLFMSLETIEGKDTLTIDIDHYSSARFIANVQSYSRSHIELSHVSNSYIAYGQHLVLIERPDGTLGVHVRNVQIGNASNLSVEILK